MRIRVELTWIRIQPTDPDPAVKKRLVPDLDPTRRGLGAGLVDLDRVRVVEPAALVGRREADDVRRAELAHAAAVEVVHVGLLDRGERRRLVCPRASSIIAPAAQNAAGTKS